MFRTPRKAGCPRLRLKVTAEDRIFVKSLSITGNGVREICRRLGERFSIGKPMSRLTLYHHFKQDLIRGGRYANRGTREKQLVQRHVPVSASEDIANMLAQSRKVFRS